MKIPRLRLAIAAMIALGVCAVEPRHLHAQFERSAPEGQRPQMVFVTDSRMNQVLTKATESLQKQDFGTAVELLQFILNSPEDFFFSPAESNKVSFRSVKAEAQRLLAQLPPPGRRAYELRFGREARSLLTEAFKTNALNRLEEVARRFFHTQAGYEATYRLGTYHLDQSEPLAAALCFQRVRKFPNVARQWEPMLSLKTAVCWGRAGLPENSIKTLIELKQATQDGRITLGGRRIPFFENDDKALQWLVAVLGQQRQFASIGLETWTMFGGGPSRNAASSQAAPVLDAAWKFRTFSRENAEEPEHFAKAETQLKALAKSRRSTGFMALSAAHPLIVGDVAVLRSAFDVKAVDWKTGKQIWQSASMDESFNFLSTQSNSAPARRGTSPSANIASLMKQRAWHDLTAGTLSSDGEFVFTVEELGVQTQTRYSRFRASLSPMWAARDYNKLVAFELRSQGKMKWAAGGARNEQGPLAGVFFLGPPLPLGKQLYCLGESSGEVRLLVLNPKDGQLKWSQSLLSLNQPSMAVSKALRRMSGISPAYADGVIVCPTTAGAVVAVDLSRRLLLWGYQYQNLSKYDPRNARAMRIQAQLMARGRSLSANLDNFDRWVDSIPIIADGRVLLTPRDSNELHCLNLIDGSVVWKKPRGQSMYLAAVHDGKVVVVGRTHVRAFKLTDGQPAWQQPTPVPTPSGRGYRTAGRYHLPLSTGEIATIDIGNGRVFASSKLRDGRVPGNLVAAGGTIVSQTTDTVVAFESFDAVRDRINDALKKNPDDAEALALRGSVRLHQGDLDRGLADLRRSIKLKPGQRARRQLVTTLLEGLRLDFSNYQQLTQEIETLVDDPRQRSTYLRLFADGLQKIGKSRAALSEYLKLAGPDTGEPTMERINAAHLVRSDRWVRGRIARVYREATGKERAELDQEIETQFKMAVERKQAEPLRKILGYFASHPVAAKARRMLVDRLDAKRDTLELEFHLLRMSRSHDPATAGFATARLASMLIGLDRVREAAPLVKKLASKWSDAVCLQDKTGRQLADEWLADKKIGPELTRRVSWPVGRVDVKRTDSSGNKQRVLTRVYAIEFVGPRGPFFENWSLALDQARRNLIARDGFGNQRWKLQISDSSPATSSSYGNSVRVHGHLLVVVLGNQFVVIDASGTAPKLLWKKSLIDESNKSTARGVRIQFRRLVFRGGVRRMVVTDPFGRPVGRVGIVTDEFICYQIGAKLYAAQTLTGKKLWVRSNVSAGSDLFGDLEYVFAVPANSNEATLYRADDGEQLGSKPIPAGSQRLTVQGRNLLTWTRKNNKQILALTDAFTGKAIWNDKEFADLSKSTLVNGDEIAVLEPTGRFTIWNLASGELRLERQVNPESKLLGIVVCRSSDQYVLLTNTSPKDKNVRRMPQLMSTNPVVNGHAYAFDRRTGQNLWPRTRVEQQAIELNQPQELPILVFACRSYRRVNKGGVPRNQIGYSVLILDRRNGQVVFEDAQAPPTSRFTVQPAADKRKIEVDFGRTRIALTFTDQPVTKQPVTKQPASDPKQKP